MPKQHTKWKYFSGKNICNERKAMGGCSRMFLWCSALFKNTIEIYMQLVIWTFLGRTLPLKRHRSKSGSMHKRKQSDQQIKIKQLELLVELTRMPSEDHFVWQMLDSWKKNISYLVKYHCHCCLGTEYDISCYKELYKRSRLKSR